MPPSTARGERYRGYANRQEPVNPVFALNTPLRSVPSVGIPTIPLLVEGADHPPSVERSLVGWLDPHCAELEPGDLPVRVQSIVGEYVGGGLAEVERDEHAARQQVLRGLRLQYD